MSGPEPDSNTIANDERWTIIRRRQGLRYEQGTEGKGMYARTLATKHEDHDRFPRHLDYIWPFDHCHSRFKRSQGDDDDDEGTYINHSMMKDAYGGEWVTLSDPKQGRRTQFWEFLTQDRNDTGTGSKYSSYWHTRQDVIVVDFWNTATGLEFPSVARSVSQTFDPRYSAIVTTGTINDRSVTHIAVRYWPNSASVKPKHQEALFNLAFELSRLRASKRIAVKCLLGVGRSGTFSSMMALMGAVDKYWERSVEIPSELEEPLPEHVRTNDPASRIVDELNEFRRAGEGGLHLDLIDKSLKWFEDKKARERESTDALE